jgi:2-dehydro-3-deoxygluconokinase
MKYDLTTFGETMVRLSVRPGQGFENETRIDFHTGGTESNTAVALARLGMKTAWVSRLTQNPLGRRVAADVARHGVDVSGIVWTPNDRVGAYYVEFATAPRAATVTYDRKHSAVSKLKTDELPWKLLLNTRVLHLTGITPALSPSCCSAVALAMKKARAKKVPISFDVNYRAKLWKPATAAKVLEPLMQNLALLTMTSDDAATVFGLIGEPETVVRQIRDRFQPGVAVLTAGGRGAFALAGNKLLHEPGFPGIVPIDRLGAGDTFTAGLIFGFLSHDLPRGLQFGIAASAMKLGMRGDYFWASREEVEQVINSRGGDVRR